MGRPAKIEDERVLDVAREVFLEKGVNATTAEVARRLGISQASVFKHFKTKQRLFIAAMSTEPDRRDWIGLFERTEKERGVKEGLTALGVVAVGFFLQVLPIALVSWSSRGHFGLPDRKGAKGGPLRIAGTLIAAFEREMAAGRMRKVDPWIALRTFIGSMQSYALVQHVFKGALGPAFTPEQYVRGVVDVIWEGLSP